MCGGGYPILSLEGEKKGLLPSQLVKVFKKDVPGLELRTAEKEGRTEESVSVAGIEGDEIVAIETFAVISKEEMIPR